MTSPILTLGFSFGIRFVSSNVRYLKTCGILRRPPWARKRIFLPRAHEYMGTARLNSGLRAEQATLLVEPHVEAQRARFLIGPSLIRKNRELLGPNAPGSRGDCRNSCLRLGICPHYGATCLQKCGRPPGQQLDPAAVLFLCLRDLLARKFGRLRLLPKCGARSAIGLCRGP